MNCATCKFARVRQVPTGRIDEDERWVTEYHCQRFPPQVVWESRRTMPGRVRTVWPEVSGHDRCGEFVLHVP
jgi:hypothetical protein